MQILATVRCLLLSCRNAAVVPKLSCSIAKALKHELKDCSSLCFSHAFCGCGVARGVQGSGRVGGFKISVAASDNVLSHC